MSTSSLLAGLGIDRAPDDSTKAMLLNAILVFADTVGDKELASQAQALMPKAHPYRFDPAWGERYADGFYMTADEDCGVCTSEMHRYRDEYWGFKDDAWRQERLQNPHLGFQDGVNDAQALNEA
jgi:hypothetical protein